MGGPGGARGRGGGGRARGGRDKEGGGGTREVEARQRERRGVDNGEGGSERGRWGEGEGLICRASRATAPNGGTIDRAPRPPQWAPNILSPPAGYTNQTYCSP